MPAVQCLQCIVGRLKTQLVEHIYLVACILHHGMSPVQPDCHMQAGTAAGSKEDTKGILDVTQYHGCLHMAASKGVQKPQHHHHASLTCMQRQLGVVRYSACSSRHCHRAAKQTCSFAGQSHAPKWQHYGDSSPELAGGLSTGSWLGAGGKSSVSKLLPLLICDAWDACVSSAALALCLAANWTNPGKLSKRVLPDLSDGRRIA